MATFELGISSANAVTFYPEWDYKAGKIQIRNEHRTRAGKLTLYKWSDYKTFEFEVNWVTASDASHVNSWFDTNTELLFLITSSGVTAVHSVMLVGKETPLAQYNKPYENYYKGSILLEGY